MRHWSKAPPKLRTVIDLARVAEDATVKRALRAAKFSVAELERLPRRILDLGAVPTRSPLEDRVYDLVVGSRLERPQSNPPYRLAKRTVYPDLYWPHLRLIVEVDSREWHDDPLARLDDAERQAELEAAGERVLRVTSADMRNPRRVLARLRAAAQKFIGHATPPKRTALSPNSSGPRVLMRWSRSNPWPRRRFG